MKSLLFIAGFSVSVLAVIAFLYTFVLNDRLTKIEKISETQQSIKQQIPTPAITTPKTLKIFDGKGSELGVYAYSSDHEIQNIFVPSVNRFINIKLSTGDTERSFDLLYATNNCSGIPYYATTMPAGTLAPVALNDANGHWQVLAKNNHRYYSVDATTKVITTHLRSSQKQNDSCKNEDLRNQNVIPVTELTLPFSLPVHLPMEVRYE